MGIPVVIHVPHADDKKKEFTERSLALCNENKIHMYRVVIDHCAEANIKMVLDAEASVAITVQPWRNVTPDVAAGLIEKYGSERIMINSDSSVRISDPLAVAKTGLALRKKGLSDEIVTKTCWGNAKNFYNI